MKAKLEKVLNMYDTVRITNLNLHKIGNKWRPYKVAIIGDGSFVEVECADIDEGLDEALEQMTLAEQIP